MRGLDIGHVDCVVLDELPHVADEYLHLAGRTGRLGRPGKVVSLVTPEEEALLGVITRQLGVSIKQDRALLRRLAAAEGEEGEAAAAL